jgi:hypothetical protein
MTSVTDVVQLIVDVTLLTTVESADFRVSDLRLSVTTVPLQCVDGTVEYCVDSIVIFRVGGENADVGLGINKVRPTICDVFPVTSAAARRVNAVESSRVYTGDDDDAGCRVVTSSPPC